MSTSSFSKFARPLLFASAAGVVAYGGWKLFSKSNVAHTEASKGVRPLVLCGPSGVGKGTLLKLLDKDFPGAFAKCVSHTTRKPRTGEVDGVDYHFTNKPDMEKEISENKFIEWANVHGNLYGTSYAAAERVSMSGRILILEIDVQGAEKIHLSDSFSIKPLFWFVHPPSRDALKERLLGRGSENEDTLKTRLETAERELDYANKSSIFHLHLVNGENLEQSYDEFKGHVLKAYPHLLTWKKKE